MELLEIRHERCCKACAEFAKTPQDAFDELEMHDTVGQKVGGLLAKKKCYEKHDKKTKLGSICGYRVHRKLP